jgi:hypothetical protein
MEATKVELNMNGKPFGSGIEVEGKQFIDVASVERLITDLLTKQREICSKVGKHHKFGYYRYKPEEMLNAKSPLE